LAVVQAQDMAKLEQLQNEAEPIEARAQVRGGNYTPQEQQRLLQIQQELIQAAGPYGGMIQQQQQRPNSGGGTNPYLPPQVNQEAQRQQQQVGQIQRGEAPGGEREGWPQASTFSAFGFTLNTPRINTANGITTYFKSGDGYVYMSIHQNWVLALLLFAGERFLGKAAEE
jgi:hypothetical protein